MTEKQIDEETGLEILVPGMVQGGPPVPSDPAALKRRLDESMASRPQQPQPLASRHLDPNFNPALGFDTGIGPKVSKKRYKVRGGYTYFYGEREAFLGPCVVYLADEEIKGQEYKLEELGGTPVQIAAAAKPIALTEDMSARERAEKIQQLKLELETLEAEHALYLEGLDKRDTSTVTQAPPNPEAESPALTATPTPSGEVDGPSFNPEAPDAKAKDAKEDKKKGGRPKGQTSPVRRVK